ncbi:MAG: phosphatase PAP2 family protein [Gemmatimonadaceae bacterium]
MPDNNPLHDAGPIARKHPRLYLTAYVGGGLVLIALMVWAFAVLADEIPEQGWMERLDHTITSLLQARGTEGGERFFVTVSLFGGPLLAALVTVVTLVLARRRDWLRTGFVALSCVGGALLNATLKQVFHRGRPEYAFEFMRRQSWSFPSGHAMNSMICYGIMLFLLLEHMHDITRRRLALIATAIVITLIAWGRVYLGVHYLSDVIAGWLAGGAWLIICIGAYNFARRRLMT